MIIPKKVSATIVDKKWLNEKVVKVDIKHISPENLIFLPGQFISLQVDESRYRAYSICSDPKNEDFITLIIDAAHEGAGSNYIRNIEIGENVTFIGPSGRFILKQELPEILYFFATGTGIAPFIPMFHKLAELNYQGKINLRFGVRYQKDLMLIEELEYFKTLLATFTYEIYISQEEVYPHKMGRITHDIDPLIHPSALYYICGNPSMVDEVLGYLLAKGVKEEMIKIEGFTHAKN